MHDPANIPFEVMCQERAMKQESTVYQFHNMLILQLPPMLIPPPPCDIPVVDAMAALPVAVCVMLAMPDIPFMTADVAVAIIEWSMTAACVFAVRVSDRGAKGETRTMVAIEVV